MTCASFYTHFPKTYLKSFVNLGSPLEFNIKFCGFEQCLATKHKVCKDGPTTVIHLIAGYSVSSDCCHMWGIFAIFSVVILGKAVKWIAAI